MKVADRQTNNFRLREFDLIRSIWDCVDSACFFKSHLNIAVLAFVLKSYNKNRRKGGFFERLRLIGFNSSIIKELRAGHIISSALLEPPCSGRVFFGFGGRTYRNGYSRKGEAGKVWKMPGRKIRSSV